MKLSMEQAGQRKSERERDREKAGLDVCECVSVRE